MDFCDLTNLLASEQESWSDEDSNVNFKFTAL